MKSIAFVDDSGDPGFNIEKGASQNFVVALVVFHDTLEAEKTAVAIKEFKRKHKIPDDAEIKFNKSKRGIRIDFLESIKSFEFFVYAIRVEKRKIHSEELKNKKDSFYKFFVKELLKSTLEEVHDMKVKIDGSGSKEFKKSFIAYLKKESREHQVGQFLDISFGNSKSNVLIQLADMFAGVIRVSFEERTDSDIYKKIVKNRIKNIWDFK